MIIINIYCILLLALGFLWESRFRGLGGKGQGPAVTLGPSTARAEPKGVLSFGEHRGPVWSKAGPRGGPQAASKT